MDKKIIAFEIKKIIDVLKDEEQTMEMRNAISHFEKGAGWLLKAEQRCIRNKQE